jgi:HK97 family phage portal protein
MLRVLDTAGRHVPVDLASSGFLTGGVGGTLDLGGIELVPGPDGYAERVGYQAVYRANPWLWACVNLIARSMSRFPIKLFAEDDDGAAVRIRPGVGSRAQTLAAALRRPGYRRSQATLVHSTMIDRLVHGNGIWFPDRAAGGAFTGMRRIPWKYTQLETIAGVDRYWDTRKPGAKRLADDVIHFGAALDCDELVNPSPIVALRATLKLYDAVERHLVAFFKNSARPGGHVEVDKATGSTARKLIREELTKLYTTPENAGKILVTSGKWTPMTAVPDNTKVIELAKQSREEICATYGIPPPLVGILDRAIMSNVRELRSHLARDVTGPHAGLFEGDIDSQLIAGDPTLGDVFVELEMGATLRPDLEARSATWKNQRYLLTLNEMRALENKPRIDHPDADVPWMPLNEAPLGADNAPPDEDDDPDDDEDAFERPEEDDDA